MIKVFTFPDDLHGYIWNLDDWLTVRIDFRIVGKLIGKSNAEEISSGLPVLLLPEEMALLKEKGLIRIVQCPYSRSSLGTFDSKKREIYSENMKNLYLEKRKKQLEEKIDVIIQGKRKKNPSIGDIDKQKLIEEELKKTKLLCEKNKNLLIKEEDILIDEKELVDAQWFYPQSNEEKLRFEIFKDLWERNFVLTCGSKFGGDFLCYEGDPLKFHSSYIVKCQHGHSKISCKELISIGRVGTSTRKTVVIASKNCDANDNIITYQCLEWISDKRTEKFTKEFKT